MTIFLVFLFGYILSQFYRTFLAVIAPEMARDLGLAVADLGALSGVWFAAFALGQFPVGWALDRFGPRRTMPVIMLSAVAGALLLAVAQSRIACLAAMALIGLGCAPIYMGALYYFGRMYQASRFAFLAALLIAVGSVGNLLGATPLAIAAQTFGWRGALAAIGALTLVAAITVAVMVDDPPRSVSASAGKGGGLIAGMRELFAIRAIWPMLPLMAVSYAVVIAERGLWVGPYLSDVYGLAPVERGNGVLAMAIAMSAGALVLGALDQPLRTRKWIVVAGSVATSIAFAALAGLQTSTLQAVALLSLAGFAGHTYAVLMAHGRSFIPDHMLGRGITMLNALFIGGAGVLQPISGAMFESVRASSGVAAAYAAIHLMFAAILAATTIIYLRAEDRM